MADTPQIYRAHRQILTALVALWAMSAQLLGAHMPTSKGLPSALHQAKQMGCTAIQVFTSSPRMWRSRPIDPSVAETFKRAKAETGISQIVSHDTYLINLCAAEPANREQSIQALIEEYERCALLGIPYVNSHMGAHVGQGEEVGIQMIADAARRVLDASDPGVMMLMETTAGAGTAMGKSFEQLAAVLEILKGDSRLGICVDTCHIFVAGYDIRTRETYENTWLHFDKVLGLNRLKAIHCNDSKGGFGSKKDRHAPIGEGELGEEPFRMLVNDPRFAKIPILLETPIEDDGHKKDLEKLKSYIS